MGLSNFTGFISKSLLFSFFILRSKVPEKFLSSYFTIDSEYSFPMRISTFISFFYLFTPIFHSIRCLIFHYEHISLLLRLSYLFLYVYIVYVSILLPVLLYLVFVKFLLTRFQYISCYFYR